MELVVEMPQTTRQTQTPHETCPTPTRNSIQQDAGEQKQQATPVTSTLKSPASRWMRRPIQRTQRSDGQPDENNHLVRETPLL